MAGSNNQFLYLGRQEADGTLSFAKEDWWEIAHAGENLQPNISSTASRLMTRRRAPRKQIRTGLELQGPINGEFVYGGYDELLRALLAPGTTAAPGEWAAEVTFTPTVDVVIARTDEHSGTIDVGGASDDDLFIQGQFYRLVGSAYADHNRGKVFRVKSFGADGLINYDCADLIDEAGVTAANAVISHGETLLPGSAQILYALVKHHSDALTTYRHPVTGAPISTPSGKFEIVRAMMVNQFGLQIQEGSVPTWNFNVLAQEVLTEFAGTATYQGEDVDFTALAADPPTAPFLSGGSSDGEINQFPASPPMDSVKSTFLYMSGRELFESQSFSMDFNNQAFGTRIIRFAGNKRTSLGNPLLTGQISAIFDDAENYIRYLLDVPTDLGMVLHDTVADVVHRGNTLVAAVPRVSFQGQGGTSNPGENSNVPVSLSWGAEETTVVDGAGGSHFRTVVLQRFPALV